MISYSSARILNRILDSQGDGTGTTAQVYAATSISGATNATPIVVTANSHGYSDGDFVNITGVVGNTACNDLHVIQSTTTNTFELTTPAGANVAGNGSYDSAGSCFLCFACKPAAGEQYCLHRYQGYVLGGANGDATKYHDQTALTNGIQVQVRQDTTLLHTLTPTPIKTGMLWGLGAEASPIGLDFLAGAAQVWTRDFSACNVNLAGDANEFFVVLNSDAMTVEQQLMSVQGVTI
jgi:hypothetical protein